MAVPGTARCRGRRLRRAHRHALVRLWLYRPSLAADARAPEKTFGFFTIVAGTSVLAVRFTGAGHPMVTAVLAALAAAVWLGLTYALPASLLLTRKRDSVLGGVNGTWLLWVVGTQPLAIAAYWILMGATAITVRAGAQLLALRAGLAVHAATAPFVAGFSFVLWSFGTWWIPLLIILGLWRHLAHHWPLAYETALWSVVFPLGMYSVATLAFGKVTKLAFMAPIAHVMLWVAIAAWAAVAVTALVRLAGRSRVATSRTGAASVT